MAKHLSNDDRMWGHYDSVGHGYETQQQGHVRPEGMGDYEESFSGLGAAPVMAGPRMVSVSSFGAAPAKKIDPMFLFGNLWKLLLKEKNPLAVAQNASSFWRRSLKDSYLLIAKANGATGVADAEALKSSIQHAAQARFKVALDMSDLQVASAAAQTPHALETMNFTGPRGGVAPVSREGVAPDPGAPALPVVAGMGLSTNTKIAIGIGVLAAVGVLVYVSRK